MTDKTFVFDNLIDSETGEKVEITVDIDKIEANFLAAKARGENPPSRSDIVRMAQDSAKQLLAMVKE